ncbi:hypothetical protein FDECE_11035 [Fusarium decemcellulare]|nr:hypothetical protein FDECE_11035 [Fusarium decemcellulare]
MPAPDDLLRCIFAGFVPSYYDSALDHPFRFKPVCPVSGSRLSPSALVHRIRAGSFYHLSYNDVRTCQKERMSFTSVVFLSTTIREDHQGRHHFVWALSFSPNQDHNTGRYIALDPEVNVDQALHQARIEAFEEALGFIKDFLATQSNILRVYVVVSDYPSILRSDLPADDPYKRLQDQVKEIRLPERFIHETYYQSWSVIKFWQIKKWELPAGPRNYLLDAPEHGYEPVWRWRARLEGNLRS